MKNLITLFAGLLLMGFGGFAAESNTTLTKTFSPYYLNYGDSFTFVEDGVTFAVFQNGEFDFYINPRSGLHVGIRNRNVNISFNSGYNYDAYVQYDNYGAIIQVEHIPIYYDYYGRVNRIGSVDIYYNHGRLTRVGGMHVYYDNRGYYSYYTGYINRYNRHYVYHPYHNFFIRPYFEYRVVSYRPYRHYYKPVRYKYYRDHSRNTYYKKYSKRNSYNTNGRLRYATSKVPKRKADRVARTERYVDSKRYATTVRNNNRSRATTARTSATTRNNRNATTVNRGNSAVKRTARTAVDGNRGNSTVTRRTQKSTTDRTRGVRTNTKQVQPKKSTVSRSSAVNAQRTRSATQRSTAPAKARTNRTAVKSSRTKSVTPRKTVNKSRTVKPRSTERRGNATSTSRTPVKRAVKKTDARKRRG